MVEHLVDGVEDFQHDGDALFAVRLQIANFGQRQVEVKAQRRIPHDRRQRLQRRRQAAELLAAHALAADRLAPLRPDHLRHAQRIELAALRRGRRPAIRRRPADLFDARLRGVFLGGPHQQLDERLQLFAADAGRRGQLIERLREQVAQRLRPAGRSAGGGRWAGPKTPAGGPGGPHIGLSSSVARSAS